MYPQTICICRSRIRSLIIAYISHKTCIVIVTWISNTKLLSRTDSFNEYGAYGVKYELINFGLYLCSRMVRRVFEHSLLKSNHVMYFHKKNYLSNTRTFICNNITETAVSDHRHCLAGTHCAHI